MNHLRKINILLVDDDPVDVEEVISKMLPCHPMSDLYIEEITPLVETVLNIHVLNSVPDGMEYIKVRTPDIALIDIYFEDAPRHMLLTDEKEEGMHLIERIKQVTCDAIPVFCVSNYIDWNQTRIDILGQRDRAISKKDLHLLTERLGVELRRFAQRALGSMLPELQAQLWKKLHTETWQDLTAKTIHHHYRLRNLMAGWASLGLDIETETPEVYFPDDIVEIIKSLLPHAHGEKT